MPFTIWDPDPSSGAVPVVIPVGDYSYDDYGFQISTEGARKLAGQFTYRTGDFFGGTKDSIVSQVTWTPTEHWRLFMSYAHDEISLPKASSIFVWLASASI